MATYWVTATLQGSGLGTSYANSMNKARHNANTDNFQPGDIIYLCDTFLETYQIIPPASGSLAGGDIIYQEDPAHPCIFEFTNQVLAPFYPNKSAIRISGKSYITVRNLSAPHCYSALEIDGNSDHITVDNVSSISAGGTNVAISFYAEDGNHITFKNCIAANAGISGIELCGNATNAISDSVIENCIAYGCAQDGIMIHENAAADPAGSNNIIRNNIAHHNGEQGFDITSGTGTLVQHNTSYSNTVNGFVMWHSAENVTFDGNISYGEAGLSAGPDTGTATIMNNFFDATGYEYALALDAAENYNVYNNTLIATPTVAGNATLMIKEAADHVVISNNIVVSTNTNKLLRSVHLGTETVSYNNNCWFSPNTTNEFHMLTTSPATYTDYSVAGFQALGHSVNDIFADPLLAGHILLPDSPCIRAGLTIDLVTNDIDGRKRPGRPGNKYSIGCWEYLGTNDPDHDEVCRLPYR